MLSPIASRSAAIGLIALAGGLACWQHRSSPADYTWRKIAWPFGRDAWPPGLAFRCVSAACGEGAEVYVRPKIGFCNCTTGVSDDEEVDRVSDLDLLSENFQPLGDGGPVEFAGLPGRSRHYSVVMPDGTTHAAAGLAVSHRCDVVVAVTQGRFAQAPGLERAAVELLSSKTVANWLFTQLGER